MTPAGFLTAGMCAGLRRGEEPGLRLGRARAGEQLPMILAGHQREGRGQHDHVSTGIAQLAEKLREADVVADRAADRDVADIVGHDVLAARH